MEAICGVKTPRRVQARRQLGDRAVDGLFAGRGECERQKPNQEQRRKSGFHSCTPYMSMSSKRGVHDLTLDLSRSNNPVCETGTKTTPAARHAILQTIHVLWAPSKSLCVF